MPAKAKRERDDLGISIDPDQGELISRQLYQQIRQLILSGRLTAGARIPTSRSLAETIGISRSTVTQIYDQLLTEGYLISRGRHGTFVSPAIPKAQPVKSSATALSDFGRNIIDGQEIRQQNNALDICFYGWQTAFDQFPLDEWARIVGRLVRRQDRCMMDYGQDALGLLELREAIAGYLLRARGIHCSAGQVLIVSGFQQALDLILRLHMSAGDAVLLENPGYPWIRLALTAGGGRCLPVPVDEQGLRVSELQLQTKDQPKLLFLTPSHQFPTGSVLPLPRRLELLAWAQKTGTLIVEDEHDSEFRYDGRLIPALKSLDDRGQVIYVGTFAKVLFPGIATGYMVLPPALCEMYGRARLLTGEQVQALIQLSLATFIQEGLLERHIGRMLDLYTNRRQALLRALKKQFGRRATVLGVDAGMHVMMRLQSSLSAKEIVSRAAANGVGLIDTAPYYVGEQSDECEFILGYGGLDEKLIREGVRRLAEIVKA